MPNIKNISALKTDLSVGGVVYHYGEVISVDKELAEKLCDSPNFAKASLEDAKSAKASSKSTPTPKA